MHFCLDQGEDFLLVVSDVAEVEHNARNNRMRAV